MHSQLRIPIVAFVAGALVLASVALAGGSTAGASSLSAGSAERRPPSSSQPAGPQAPQASLGTAFTYQGQLKKSGAVVNDTCDFQFGLYDASTLGAQIGVTQTVTAITVTSGLFTAALDFGAGAFNGDARYLATSVRCPAGSGLYQPLTPRQALTGAPYALYAMAPWVPLSNTISYNSNVGIRTTNPDSPLVVKSDNSSYGIISTNGTVDMGTFVGSYGPYDGGWLGTRTNHPLYLFTYDSTDPNVTIDVSGRVGVGTAWPSSTLQLATGYLQLPITPTIPAGDCNSALGGRIAISDTASATRMMVCSKATGQWTRPAGGSPQNVLIVAKSGGDFTTIGAALASITNNNASNRWLIWVAPGTYNETITMKPYVDIEGAGESQTTISAPGTTTNGAGATVIGGNPSSLRNLTIVNTGAAAYAEGVFMYNPDQAVDLSNVTIRATGGLSYTYGVIQAGASPKMDHVSVYVNGPAVAVGVDKVLVSGAGPSIIANSTISVTGVTQAYGIIVDSDSIAVNDSTIGASGSVNSVAVYQLSQVGQTTIDQSTLIGATYSISTTTGHIYVSGSKLGGPAGAIAPNGAINTCIYSFNTNYTAVGSTCN